MMEEWIARLVEGLRAQVKELQVENQKLKEQNAALRSKGERQQQIDRK